LLDNEGFAALTDSFDDKGVVVRLIFPLQEGIFYFPFKHMHSPFDANLHFFGGIIQ
jgi:hypothetical protein